MRAVVVAAAAAIAHAYGDGAARHRLKEAEGWLYDGAPPPSHWEITSKRDLAPSSKWSDLSSGNSKRVRATTYSAQPVVVKEARAKGHWNERNVRGELLWLEYLRGAPGVPNLYGAWATEDRIVWVVSDGERPARSPRRASRMHRSSKLVDGKQAATSSAAARASRATNGAWRKRTTSTRARPRGESLSLS